MYDPSTLANDFDNDYQYQRKLYGFPSCLSTKKWIGDKTHLTKGGLS